MGGMQAFLRTTQRFGTASSGCSAATTSVSLDRVSTGSDRGDSAGGLPPQANTDDRLTSPSSAFRIMGPKRSLTIGLESSRTRIVEIT
jgi:hypothetical protein